MKLHHKRPRLEFQQIAKEWVAEDGRPGSDAYLKELVASVWLGDFEDDAGRSCLFLNARPKARRFNRRELLSALRRDESRALNFVQIPAGAFIPDTHDFAVLNKRRGAKLWDNIESWDSQMAGPWESVRDTVPWSRLAALWLSHYSPHFVETYLKRLCISKGDFRRWCRRHNFDLPEFWFPRAAGTEADARTPESQPASAKAIKSNAEKEAGEQTVEGRRRALQRRATALRKAHQNWPKPKIANFIYDNDDFQKYKGEGKLTAEAIEREIRLPRPKRRTPR